MRALPIKNSVSPRIRVLASSCQDSRVKSRTVLITPHSGAAAGQREETVVLCPRFRNPPSWIMHETTGDNLMPPAAHGWPLVAWQPSQALSLVSNIPIIESNPTKFTVALREFASASSSLPKKTSHGKMFLKKTRC